MNLDQLNKVLADLKFESFHFYFATNTVGFQLFDKDKNKDYLLIINPQWRIVKKDGVVNSSLSCPWHGDYENQDDYKSDFKDWCDSVKFLKEISITRLEIISELGDLRINWNDGSKLETFISCEEEDYWYLEHEKELKRYVVGYKSVTIANMQLTDNK